ncbi:unnamed protein product [Discosporangium mesarthrocarpum]
MPLSVVCEQVMDHCLSSDPRKTTGIGGDNMTCLIVQVGFCGCTREVVRACGNKNMTCLYCIGRVSWMHT